MKHKPSIALLAASAFLVASVVAYLHWHPKVSKRPNQAVAARTPAKPVPNTPTALRKFIAQNQQSPSKKMQDVVAQARLNLAFDEAEPGKGQDRAEASLATARHTFLLAAKEYKGTGVSSADFGSLPDQAIYQADVCLLAEGKTKQAEKAFREFMQDRPSSPLCKACLDRLRRIEGGFKDGAYVSPKDLALYNHDIAVQSAKIKYQTSLCGPECVQRILSLIGRHPATVAEIAKGCGRTDQGVSIYGIRKYLDSVNVRSFAAQVNAADFRNLPTPFIYSVPDHFILVTKIQGSNITTYDPLTKSVKTVQAPKVDDASFTANVITLSPPSFQANAN